MSEVASADIVKMNRKQRRALYKQNKVKFVPLSITTLKEAKCLKCGKTLGIPRETVQYYCDKTCRNAYRRLHKHVR